MTLHKQAKKAARARAAATGSSYAAARREDSAGDQHDAWEHPPTAEELLSSGVEHQCGELVGWDMKDLGDVEVLSPVPLVEPRVHAVAARLDTLEVHPCDTYEGGQVVANVMVEADVRLEGIVSSGVAARLHETKLADIVDGQIGRGDALVALRNPQPVRVELFAGYTLDAETVEDISYAGASSID